MDDLNSLASVLETLVKNDTWRPQEVRAVLRAARALAREKGCPGSFESIFRPGYTPTPPSAA